MKLAQPLICAGIATLVGCAASPERVYLDSQAALLAQTGAGVMTTACAVRQSSDGDIVLRAATVRIADGASAALQDELARYGFRVTTSIIPGLCLPASADARVRLAEDSGAKPTAAAMPLQPDARLAAAPELAAIYARLLKAVAAMPLDVDKARVVLELDEADARALAAEFGADHVWVMQAFGVRPDPLGAFLTAMTVELIVALVLGPGGPTQVEVDVTGYYLSLVDLANRELVWRKRSARPRTNPEDPEIMQTPTFRRPLEPFVDRWAKPIAQP